MEEVSISFSGGYWGKISLNGERRKVGSACVDGLPSGWRPAVQCQSRWVGRRERR